MVYAHLREQGLSSKGGALKALLLIFHFGFWYLCALEVGQRYGQWVLLASAPLSVSLVLVMLGAMHDGSHGAVSERRLLNRLVSWTLVLAGGSAISWHREHVVRHHAYTNTYGLDSDLESGGLLRFHPAQHWHPLHRYQHWYAWVLYGLMSLKWAWFEDFDDVIRNPYRMKPRQRAFHALEVLISKFCHVVLFLVLPIRNYGVATALTFYVLLFFLVSLLMAIVFVLAHLTGEQNLFDSRERAPKDWAHLQLQTTANFSTGNALLSWLIGGLNYQIEHHLFPSVSHRHYPMIRPLVRRWAAQHGAPYREYPSLFAALSAHCAHLSRLGKGPTLTSTPELPRAGNKIAQPSVTNNSGANPNATA